MTNSPFSLYANYGNGKKQPDGYKPTAQPDTCKPRVVTTGKLAGIAYHKIEGRA